MATYEKVSRFRQLRNDMKDMTFGEKIGHLWEYYKWFAIVGIALIIATVSVVFSVLENSKELAYGGKIVNLAITEEGEHYLKEGWFEAQGGDSENQRIELETLLIPNLNDAAYNENAAATATKLVTTITMGEVDYVLADLDTIIFLCRDGSFSPLNDVLTAEQLQQFEGKLFAYKSDTEEYWVAIDITELPFVKKHISLSDGEQDNRVCIAFPGNTGRSEKNGEFLEYLLNWSE
jgi:hypothetical protein